MKIYKLEETMAVIKNNRKVIMAVVVVLVLGALAYYGRGWVIAATVDGTPIARLSVISLLEKQSGKNALDLLINKMLIEKEAKAKNITVSNDELIQSVKDIESEITAQGGTLQTYLKQNGIAESEFRKQVTVQKELEKLLGDKIQVTDQEVEQYIATNKVTLPKGQEDISKKQIASQLQQQKLSQEAPKFLSDLKAAADINYFVNY